MAIATRARLDLREVQRGSRGEHGGRIGGAEHALEASLGRDLVSRELGKHGVAKGRRDAVELGRHAECGVRGAPSNRRGGRRLRARGYVVAAGCSHEDEHS